VIVTLSGCASDTSNIINVILNKSDNINYGKLLEFYPNPSSDKIILDYHTNNMPVKIEIFDAMGKIQAIFPEKIKHENRFVLDVSNLSNGIYYLKINDCGTGKIIVRH
jgi:hypothetical protein